MEIRMLRFLTEGGRPLKGEVKVHGSKNAALPILAATLLTDEPCIIKNVPEIDDVETMVEILKVLGKEATFENHTVTVWKGRPVRKPVPQKLACKMRASVLLLGPMLARFSGVSLPLPGGCVLGKRPFTTHIKAFGKFGVEDHSTADMLKLKAPRNPILGAKVALREFSVTATENVLLAASLASGITEIHLAATEPHVQDLCLFLKKIGVMIEGIGTHTLRVTGKRRLSGAQHVVTSDYLEAGTLAIAAALTKGDILLKDFEPDHLTALWNLLETVGVELEFAKHSVRVRRAAPLKSCGILQTAVYPGFPTDLQAPFAVLLTQCEGEACVHETLFEGRLNYLAELKKMGANAEIQNEREAVIHGPSKLRGTQVQSCDIRAGVAMLLAGLCASGETEILNVQYVDRGYEKFDETLRSLGARIERFGDAKSAMRAGAKKRIEPLRQYRFDIPILPLR